MDEYKKIDLARMFEKSNSVTITIVNDENESFDKIYTNLDECLQDIEGYSIENEVYF